MARIAWRALQAKGFPSWVRDLKGSCGVYAIRDRASGEVLYVGESHGCKLYDTVTRHFQRWSRGKRFWKGLRGDVHDPGTTYQRARCDVAIWLVEQSKAVALQNALIRQLKPRDNINGAEAAELEAGRMFDLF